jgi:NADH:ubiquinone reductase (H+-translocating)
MKPHVVIIGAGFGGLTCAQELERSDVRVTLVDRTNHHLFQPLLYQVAMAGLSPADIAAPIRGILSAQENARVLLGEVTAVDLVGNRVVLDVDPGEVAYDYLVLALGAKTSYFGHDEWEAFAPGLKSLNDAVEIRARVLMAFEKAEREDDPEERKRLLQFVVIGGGPTGVELAGAIAELAHTVLAEDFRAIKPNAAKVTLIEAGERVLVGMAPELSQAAKEQLEELGVVVRTHSRVTKIDERGVELDGKELLAAKTVLWGAGVAGTRLNTTLGVALDKQNRVVVDPHCAIAGHPNVFAIGDMARFEENGAPLPGVSPVALQQAAYVAAVITQEVGGVLNARKPFHYFDKGMMATIGRKRAVAQAGGVQMRGAVAWLAWLFVHLWFLIGFRNRFVVLFTWVWSYVFYKRGARIITSRVSAFEGERPTAARNR